MTEGTLAGVASESVTTNSQQAIPAQALPARVLRLWLEPYVSLLKSSSSIISAAAVVVTAAGLLIAGPHFARAGVPTAKLPIILFVATGLSFVATTGVFIFLGLAVGFSPTRRTAFATLGVGLVLFVGQLSSYLGLSLGFLIYVFVPLAGGYQVGRSIAATQGQNARKTSDWYSAAWRFLLPLVYLGGFARTAYPGLPAELGGGRPKPVHLRWLERPEGIPEAAATYEVFRDDSFLYVAADPDDHSGLLDRLTRLTFSPSVQYVAVPISQVRSITYLPWVAPLGFGSSSVSETPAREGHVVERIDGGLTDATSTGTDAGTVHQQGDGVADPSPDARDAGASLE